MPRSPRRAVGSRAQVMHGNAHHTSGGLTKGDLKYNRSGKIVSRRASASGKKAMRRMIRDGDAADPFTRSGGRRKRRSKSRRKRRSKSRRSRRSRSRRSKSMLRCRTKSGQFKKCRKGDRRS